MLADLINGLQGYSLSILRKLNLRTAVLQDIKLSEAYSRKDHSELAIYSSRFHRPILF